MRSIEVCSASWVCVRMMPGQLKDPLQHVVEVLVRAGDDAQVEVARPGDGVDLQHLADVRQSGEDLGVASLGDLERREGEHAEPRSGGVEVGTEPDDDPVSRHPIEMGLHGSPGHVEPAGHLHHRQVRRGAQQADESGVEVVPAFAGHGAQPFGVAMIDRLDNLSSPGSTRLIGMQTTAENRSTFCASPGVRRERRHARPGEVTMTTFETAGGAARRRRLRHVSRAGTHSSSTWATHAPPPGS